MTKDRNYVTLGSQLNLGYKTEGDIYMNKCLIAFDEVGKMQGNFDCQNEPSGEDVL